MKKTWFGVIIPYDRGHNYTIPQPVSNMKKTWFGIIIPYDRLPQGHNYTILQAVSIMFYNHTIRLIYIIYIYICAYDIHIYNTIIITNSALLHAASQ